MPPVLTPRLQKKNVDRFPGSDSCNVQYEVPSLDTNLNLRMRNHGSNVRYVSPITMNPFDFLVPTCLDLYQSVPTLVLAAQDL